jgi:nucleotide-binding universal stress UspA family protein
VTTRPELRALPDGSSAPRRRLRIVVGVDGSPAARRALRWCVSLAQIAEVEVVAVHALEGRTYPPEFRRPLPRAASRSRHAWREEIRERIDDEWCAGLREAGLRLGVMVGDGRPWSVLAAAARQHASDLVAVGCRPRGALAEALRPGVGRRLTRDAPCPVAVVPAATAPGGPEDPVLPPPRTIVAAWDGGAAAPGALGWSARLAADLGAELVAARVVDPGAPAPGDTTMVSAGQRPRELDELRDRLEAECARLSEAGLPRHRAAVLVGQAPSMLLALVEAEGTGIVVVGVDERRRPGWLRSGAVASLLTRQAPCTVVLVPAREHATTPSHISWRTDDMSTQESPTRRPRGVRFAAGTVVSPGEYRNAASGAVRYFDGTTPLPGGVNGSSWQQVSDHYHAHEPAALDRRPLIVFPSPPPVREAVAATATAVLEAPVAVSEAPAPPAPANAGELAVELIRRLVDADGDAVTELFAADAHVFFPVGTLLVCHRGHLQLRRFLAWMRTNLEDHTLSIERVSGVERTVTVDFDTRGRVASGEGFDRPGAMIVEAEGGRIRMVHVALGTQRAA